MSRICTDGQLIAERFRIVRFIAEGGMGEVYEAEDSVLGERVALKFLSRRSADDPQVMRRFHREVQLARKVTHPNVCRLFDVYRHRLGGDGLGATTIVFVTMELLAGETLEARLERSGPYVEDAAFDVAAQMVAALGAAHDAGVVHRDFKTSNVMLVPRPDGGERVVVTDFGLARSMDGEVTRLTGEMGMLGTPDYMSPEQLRGRDAGPQADIYALGVVLFEMVTGERPYLADNTMSLLVKRVSEAPRSPRSIVPALSEPFEKAIVTCMAREPADRFRSAFEVIAALGGTAAEVVRTWSGPLPHLPEPTPVPRPGPPRWLVPVAVSVIVLAALVAWWSRAGVGRPAVRQALAPRQLTTAPGLELDPAFSPDGRSLVYSNNAAGAFELFVRDLSPGGGDTQLTFGGTQAFEPAWSPDGRAIVFHASAAGGIWQVPAGGGEPLRLTGFGSRPALSPDGATLVFQSESRPALSDTSAPALARSQLWTVDLGGGAPRPLTEVGRPAGGHAAPCFSPDGRRVIFTASRRGRSEIWQVPAAGGEPVALVLEPSNAFDPVFSASGDAVYFSASDRQVNGLWRLPVSRRTGEAATPAEQVANVGLASIRQLAISPLGSTAVYTALVTTSNLYLLPIDGGGVPTGPPRALTAGSGRNNRAVFAPDGRRLAYDHWRLGVEIDLFTFELATGSVRQITADPAVDTQPSWFPDGRALLFSSERDGGRALWRIDLPTAATEHVMAVDDDVDWVRLSPDGSRLVYHSRSGGPAVNVWVRPIAGGAPLRLTSATELAGFPVWSPDGEHIAYQQKQAEDSHLMVVPAAGGEPRQLTSGPGESWPSDFSPDGDKVLFAGKRAEGWNLWWVSRTTGETRRLTDLGRLGAYVRYPAWSPAGDRIVFELAETVGDVWMIDRLP